MTKSYDAAFRDALELAAESRQSMTDSSPDTHVESVREKLLRRSVIGLKKYGVTTERKDIDTLGWLIHWQEELMDACIYAETLIKRHMVK